jgi:hypothetical protein
MRTDGRGAGLASVIWSLAGILVVATIGFHLYHAIHGHSIQFSTPYQAVLLTNGSYGTSHRVLTDVYYVVSQGNPETKQVTNSLIKRGKELHEPDRMYLNPNQIVFVEPVGPNSKVAQLIAEQKKQ